MIPLDVLGVFFLASVLLALAPGPDNIFVLTQAAMNGPRAGLAITAGLCSGLAVHTAAVAFGVAVLLQASAVAFTVLKVVGAAYLLYLAWQAATATAEKLRAGKTVTVNFRRLYLRGIVMNVTNPKVSMFFLAFLPQFADPQRGPVATQVLLLGAVFALAAVLVFSAVAVFAGHLGQWLMRSTRALRVMNRTAAAVFAGLAVKLLITDR